MCWKGLKLSCASSLGWSDSKLAYSTVRHLRFLQLQWLLGTFLFLFFFFYVEIKHEALGYLGERSPKIAKSCKLFC